MNKMFLRAWLFSGLVLLVTGLLVLSWFLPWWGLDIEEFNKNDAIIIHPYGLEDKTNLAGALGVAMPDYFAPLMWLYLSLVVAASLIGVWVRDKRVRLLGIRVNIPNLIIGVAGFSYIVVAITAAVYASIRLDEVGGIPLLGRYYLRMGGGMLSWVNGSLMLGYWLACASGLLLVALALFRGLIIGKAGLGMDKK